MCRFLLRTLALIRPRFIFTILIRYFPVKFYIFHFCVPKRSSATLVLFSLYTK